jgi:phosphatidylglycerophosphate synthase
VLTFRSGPAVGLIALIALLAALQASVGLGASGWIVALTCGTVINAAVARGLARYGGDGLGPADLVTLMRATLACGAAALVADSFLRPPAPTVLVALAVGALVLDAVDGWIARRTGTVSLFGAVFDGEVDAFLMAVLSVYVARSVGWWVLAIGAARYLFALAGWRRSWMRRHLPPRRWRKVVAATQGVVLTTAAADVLPLSLTYAALAVALALLAESFGRDVWWLWVQRRSEADSPSGRSAPAGLVAGLPGPVPEDGQGAGAADRPRPGRSARRPALSAAVNVLALLVVWFALVAPNQAYRLTPGAFLRIPVEGLVVAALAVVLPSWARRTMAAVVGVFLGLLTIVKLLDMGFFEAFDRPFNVTGDRGYLLPAVELAKEEIGAGGATVAVVAAVVLVLALLVCMPLAVGRLTALLARHRTWSIRTVTVLAMISVAGALTGLQMGRAGPIASTSAGHLAADHVEAVAADADEEEKFDAAVSVDRYRDERNGDLLAGLGGKDVLLVFVESYGRIALDGSSSPQIRALLDASTRQLQASGYSSASGFLTSSTFGGLSWLAHGTLQSGLWVDNQIRYERLLSGNRLTLTRAFGQAGWRTVALMPSDSRKWPEGKAFYQFDKIYGRYDLGYRGPRFGFAKMPDQFALAAFQRLELARRNRGPVMAEIDLASSHQPWARFPRMVPWNRLGDGSIFEQVTGQDLTVHELWDNPADVRAAYAQSLGYSLRTVVSFVRKYGDRNTVVVVLGDHQPGTVVTGHGASRDVPISIIAHDRTVLDRISAWGWQGGMTPDARAPVWRMDAFRDRFFAAYGR